MVLETQYANNVFEQPWWLDIVAENRWKEAVVEENGEVVARLPYSFSGKKIQAPLYTQTLGIWMREDYRNISRGNDQYNKQKQIIHQLLEQIQYKKIDIVLDSSQQYVLPFRWEGFFIEPTFSYRIENINGSNDFSKNFSKNIKRDLNRGKKTLTISEGLEGLEDFICLQNHTYSRQNRKNPIDNEFTRNVILKVMEIGHGQLFIARDSDGAAHAGSFVVFDDKVCYHLLSGQNTEFGNDCAMPVLFQKEFEFASKNSQIFDFEGSMVEGIEQVYRRYGGKQVINWHVHKMGIVDDIKGIIKPRVKRMIGYKM